LVGSQRYVQSHSSDPITAMLNFDVNAYGKTIVFGNAERTDNVELRRTFLQTCAAEDVTCVGFPQLPPSDDRSFVQAGKPTLSVAILPSVEAHQMWLMLNAPAKSGLAQGTVPAVLQMIHTPEDSPDKVSEESMTLMFRFARSLVRSLARR
jgi:peptidase M28-like protein